MSPFRGGKKVIRNERSDVEEKSSAEAQNEAFKRQSLLLSSTDKSTRNTHTHTRCSLPHLLPLGGLSSPPTENQFVAVTSVSLATTRCPF